MHIPSSINHDELLAVPQFIRFDYIENGSKFEPTLIIKGNSLLIKYIISGSRIRLSFTSLENKLVYVLTIFDDGEQGGTLWSYAESKNEISAAREICLGGNIEVFLFNEAAVNVSHKSFNVHQIDYKNLFETVAPTDRDLDGSRSRDSVEEKLTELQNSIEDGFYIIELNNTDEWNPINAHFYRTNESGNTGSNVINVFDKDEGAQQERIAIWLTDRVQPMGVYHSPQRPFGESETKELTDVLINYELGCALIESKALSLFTRDSIPERAKLEGSTRKHLEKAFKQLKGAIRNIKEGTEIKDTEGNTIDIERKIPPHAIVLVTDLDLARKIPGYDKEFIDKFLENVGGIPHILDISELLRIVQAAEIISQVSDDSDIITAMDYYLIERLNYARNSDSLCIEVILRVSQDILDRSKKQ